MNFSEFKKKYQKQDIKEHPNKVKTSPVVSVLVQTYQHKKFIRQCLERILMQKTTFSYEILVGEDGSEDGTREICIEYAEKYPDKIRLFLHHQDNKIKVLGVTTGNFNAFYNFFSAKGEFIAFCEGDDYWADPYKLQKQVCLLNKRSFLSMTYHSYIEVNKNGLPLPVELALDQPTGLIYPEDLKKLNLHPLLSTVCFRNYFKDGIPKEMVEILNVDSFLISLLGNNGGAEFIEDIVPSFYRRHEGGIWTGKGKKNKFDSKILTYQTLANFYAKQDKQNLAQFYRELILKVHKMQIVLCLKNRDFSGVAAHFKKIMLKNNF